MTKPKRRFGKRRPLVRNSTGADRTLYRGTPAVALLLLLLAGCASTPLEPWHTKKLVEEFTVDKAETVVTLADYQALEERLFEELEAKVYDLVDTGPQYALVRYSRGSAADPRVDNPNWNRSFEMTQSDPLGAVLLLHGMSDSPYSLRTVARTLHEQGYHVLALRMPGHGTAPSGLRFVDAEDMIAAVRLGMRHLSGFAGDLPIHIIGYSTGGTLALDYTLDATAGIVSPVPTSLILISPAIRIHGAARLARFQDRISIVPGLGRMSWLSVEPEFDPYKYNSFATNAGHVVHTLTRSIDGRLAERAQHGPVDMPPILVFKSTVDSTVTTEAVVDNLLSRLDRNRHRLVLFDINRTTAKSTLLIDDPGPLTYRLMSDDQLPFAVTFVVNESPESTGVVARHKQPFAAAATDTEELDMAWPFGVMSLSHVALPFPPDDPLYGGVRPESETRVYLGELAMKGERGLVRLPGDWQLRMRYNPFYPVVEKGIVEWIANAEGRRSSGMPVEAAN